MVKNLSLSRLGKKFINLLSNKFDRDEFLRLLILEESKLGADIFGPRKPGHRRDFFLYDANTWVWNEQVDTPTGPHVITTRYIVEGDRVYKSQDGGEHQRITGEELENLHQSAQIYLQKAEALYATL